MTGMRRRPTGWTGWTRRDTLRRVGAVLALMALVVQAMVLLSHRPALAQSQDWFALDPAAWCLPSGYVPVSDDGTGGADGPLGASICPICQVLQHAGNLLPPAEACLDLPGEVRRAQCTVRVADVPRNPALLNFNPRAPPASI